LTSLGFHTAFQADDKGSIPFTRSKFPCRSRFPLRMKRPCQRSYGDTGRRVTTGGIGRSVEARPSDRRPSSLGNDENEAGQRGAHREDQNEDGRKDQHRQLRLRAVDDHRCDVKGVIQKNEGHDHEPKARPHREMKGELGPQGPLRFEHRNIGRKKAGAARRRGVLVQPKEMPGCSTLASARRADGLGVPAAGLIGRLRRAA